MLRSWQLWWLSEYLTMTMINAVNQDVLFYATNVYNWIWYVTVGMSRKIHCINVSTLIKLTVLFFAIFIIYRQVFLQFSTDNKLLWLIEFGLNRIPQLPCITSREPHSSGHWLSAAAATPRRAQTSLFWSCLSQTQDILQSIHASDVSAFEHPSPIFLFFAYFMVFMSASSFEIKHHLIDFYCTLQFDTFCSCCSF